ncbi:Na+/H+ antiporter NhaC [Cytobacillus spongiae]|uniref:Na+/H+ antiporter NhaC n=1 Tax=Cytobacillus spongiae TaxID=2901381 RepID=UPI003D7B1456
MENQSVITVKPLEALLMVILILGGISYTIISLGAVPHIPILLATFLLIGFGLFKKVSMKEIENGMVEGAKSGLGAVMIFFFIGVLISSWMMSGTIPTFIYLALSVVDGKFFYAIVFLVTAIVGISIGSSLTTSATIGVAFISVSTALGLSEAITAGAVISGAFFGDKMSPLSDTTNLASMLVKVDLFEHIRNMLWTTIPAFVLSFIMFMVLSPKQADSSFQKLQSLKEGLLNAGFIHWYTLIPFVILTALAIRKVSAILTLSAGILTAIVISFVVNHSTTMKQIVQVLYSGYTSTTGIEELDALLSRGGIESMLFSISLVILALSMGGLLFKLGILPALLDGVKGMLHKVPMLISSTAATAIGINFLVGEQYLSILLTGNTFKEPFQKAGLHLKNLSRVLEDAGTVVNPLVPWGVCGVFLTSVLGVSTLDYLPFTFFCLFSPLLTVVYGLTGFRIIRN